MTNTSLAPRAANSTFWSVIQNGGKHAMALVIFVLMARLLDPDAYGAVALAGVVVTLVNALVEQGFNDALVQRDALEPGHLNAAFWLMLCSAGVFATVLFLLAPVIAVALGMPAVAPVMRWLALLFPLQALAIVPQALLQRAFCFRTLTLRTLAALLAGGVVGVWLAMHGAGVWSLVAQQITGAATALIVLWAGSRWRPGIRFSRRHALELYRFSRHVIGFNLLDFLKRKSDDFIIGVFLGPVALGTYSLAYQMLLMMEQLMCKGFDAVALSAFSRMRGDPLALREAFYTVARLSALVAFPAFLGAGLVMPELVAALLGEKWRGAVPVIQVLLLVGALHSVFHYNHAVFKACGRPHLSSKFAVFEALANIALFLLVVHRGIEAVAVAYVAVGFAMAPFSLWAVRDLLGLDVLRYLRQFLVPLGACVLMAAGVMAAEWGIGGQFGSRALLALLIVTGVVSYVASLRLLAPALGTQVLAQMRIALRPSAQQA